jgi:hypothetical protein
MGIQTGLEEFAIKHNPIDIGKAVRNTNYHMMDSVELNNGQRIVLEELLKHPDGINDKGIAVNTGLPLSSVCGRRNELMKQGLVAAIGIGIYPDYKGRFRPNITWGVVIR